MKNKKLFILLLLIPIIIFFVGRSFSLEQEVKSIEIQSDDYSTNTPGSWHITKSAEWTGFGKAKVTFDVNSITKSIKGLENNMDVIFVIDISASMRGEKLDRVKQDARGLADYLSSNPNNKMALITFDSYSEIKLDFTNNKNEIMNALDAIDYNLYGDTSYYEALYNVEVLMRNYEREEGKELIMLFLTDGYPNKDSPGEVAWYSTLKEEFPYMTMNGIQYEMGTEIIQEIINITDNQWVADMSTLYNVLFDATVAPLSYENFIITDYINDEFFYINSVEDIVADRGNVSLELENGIQKITWNLGNNYKMGQHATIEINISLKEEFNDVKGLYETNKRETITTKVDNEEETVINSELTPVLKNKYKVFYQIPTECTWDGIDSGEYYVGETVTIQEDWPACEGYLFKGYQIDSNDVLDMQMINDDMFFMPGHDVTIRGIWTKQTISKNMNGSVHEKATLYSVFSNEYKSGNLVEKSNIKYYDSFDKSKSTRDIYYWNGSISSNIYSIQNKYNVIFADHCWQMIRTTDTGGVKLLYNGEPENGRCYTNRGNHVGYTRRTSITINDTYYYGTDYTYDKSNNKFSLNGEVVNQQWNISNFADLNGKYTCLSSDLNGTCTTLYLIESYKSNDEAYVIPLNANANYSEFGKIQYNEEAESLAYVGYMYNSVVPALKKELKYTETPLEPKYVFSFNNLYYGYGVNWGNPVEDNYNLVWPGKISYVTGLAGRYTFFSTDQSYTSNEVYYIADAQGGNGYNTQVYMLKLTNGDLSSINDTYTLGNAYIDNNDGTYTVVNRTYSGSGYTDNPARTIRRVNWNSSDHSGSYICKNAVNDTCTDLWNVQETSGNSFTYLKVNDNFKYGSNYSYNNQTNTYELTGDVFSSWKISDYGTKQKLNTHHYTCFNVEGKCETLYYIFWSYDTWYYFTAPYYVELKNGQSVDDILDLMLYNDNVNETNSIIKTGVDAWYKHYLLEYDRFIDDVVYCNDRKRDTSYNDGWNPDGGSVFGKTLPSFGLTLQLSNFEFTHSICENDTDRFSISNNKAKLKYKVGLITYNELENLGDFKDLRKTNQAYWTLTPSIFYQNYAAEIIVSEDGSFYSTNVSAYYNGNSNDGSAGVRPVIALKSDVEYISGNGSTGSPFIINTND